MEQTNDALNRTTALTWKGLQRPLPLFKPFAEHIPSTRQTGRMALVDWGTIVPVGITALVGLAGIGGTLVSVKMTARFEDKRVKLADRRRIYANCLTALYAGFQAVTREAKAEGALDVEDRALIIEDVTAALNAVNEVQLVGSVNVAKLAMESFLAVIKINPESGHGEWAKVHARLVAMMRTDMGEALD